MTQQLLLACVVAPKRAAQARASSEADETASNSNDNDNAVEPLTHTRLNEIKRSVAAKASIWSDLRRQYPPQQSEFAPLSLTARSNAGNNVTLGAIAADDVFSQAATMAAYGIELLHVAIDSPKVDKRRIRQVSDLLSSLCATFVAMRQKNRERIASSVERGTEGVDHISDVSTEPGSANVSQCARVHRANPAQPGAQPTNALETTRTAGTDLCPNYIRRQPGGRVERESHVNERWHPYNQTRMCFVDSRERLRRQHSECKEQSIRATSDTSLSSATSSITDMGPAIASASAVVDSSCAGDTTTRESSNSASSDLSVDFSARAPRRASKPRLPAGLSRQEAIRAAFLRQGRPESTITAYFGKIAKNTSRNYDSLWNKWAIWCVEQGLDPSMRAEAELEAHLLERGASKDWAMHIKVVAREVWSITDPPQEDTAIPKRQKVIRAAFLRRGQSETNVAKYFGMVSKQINLKYDLAWERWIAWCAERGLDSIKRCEANLSKYVEECSTSESGTWAVKSAVRAVWEIVDESLPLTTGVPRRSRNGGHGGDTLG
ncbi:hypothetical protein GGH95_000031 [Coemansia sp. RSA 1836]|nr:hypothetical protein GGH95_000031 [Coemansia sp. RSA 1836]